MFSSPPPTFSFSLFLSLFSPRSLGSVYIRQIFDFSSIKRISFGKKNYFPLLFNASIHNLNKIIAEKVAWPLVCSLLVAEQEKNIATNGENDGRRC